MMDKKCVTELPNGITVATDKVVNAKSVSVGVWLPFGSGSENRENNGLCHFYEHLVFKGTKNRTSFDIGKEIEDLGGNLNAYTAREATCFYVLIAKEHLQTAISVLADLVMSPKLLQRDFEKEKSVVLEEIRSSEDNPEDVADDLFYKKHFAGCGFEYPIAGTIKSVQNLTLGQVRKYQKFILEEMEILISAAGDIEHNKFIEMCRKAFLNKTHGQKHPSTPYSSNQSVAVLERSFQQANVFWGTSADNLNSKECRSLHIFHHIFGDGFTSRLFQNIREKYGLVYTINSSADIALKKNLNGKHSALFQIYFATDVSNLERVMDLVKKEMRLFMEKGFAPQELERAKKSIIGSIKLSQDNISTRQSGLARQILRYGHPVYLNEIENEIKRISCAYIEKFIHDFFSNSKCTFAAVLPKSSHVLSLNSLKHPVKLFG